MDGLGGFRDLRRCLLAMTLTLAAALGAGAAPASATLTVQAGAPTIRVNGQPGREVLNVDFRPSGAGEYVFLAPPRFGGIRLAPGSPCTVDGGREVTCPEAGFTGLEIRMAGGKDSVIATDAVRLPTTMIGGTGPDDLEAGAGDDRVLGGPGNDMLNGGMGADLVAGNAGIDRAAYISFSRSAGVKVTLDGRPNDGSAEDSAAGGNRRDNVKTEGIIGSYRPDRLFGNRLPNYLSGAGAGGGGGDLLVGRGGNDVFAPESGRNVLLGGPGNDRLYGGPDPERFFGGPGIDQIFARNVNKRNNPARDRDRTINCGPGNNRRERATVDRADPRPISC